MTVAAKLSQGDHEVPLLEVQGVTKSYGAVRALVGVSLECFPGEVHALIGENGAGKSTLVKSCAGAVVPDSGQLLVNGLPVDFANPADAIAAGIAVIYQEPTLFPDLSVAENIFMGRQPLRRGRIDISAMNDEATALMTRLGVKLTATQSARGLPIADQQIVEIARALSLDANVIFMDEPTAALSGPEVERLFAVVESLRAQDKSIVFISHRLDEVLRYCQRVTVFRDGGHVFTGSLDGLTSDDLVRYMVGRDLDQLFVKQEVTPGEVVLTVEGLSRQGSFEDVSFTVRAGEIVCLAGMVGAGRTEVACSIFGIDRPDAGTVEVAGSRIPRGSPEAAMAAGIALVPEDRRQQGLVLEMSVERNATMATMKDLTRFGVLFPGQESARATEWNNRLQVSVGRLKAPAWTLSGGNQQKVVLGKWLATRPKLLIVDEPTRGIDIGTKAEVHKLLSSLAAEGMAVLMISSELLEVLGLADRVLVMREGRLVAEMDRRDAHEHAIVAAASGATGRSDL